MGVTMRWDDPATQMIILYEFALPWTWEDYQQAVLATKALLDNADLAQPPSIILYSRTRLAIPPNPLPHLQRLLKVPLPQIDSFIVVGAPVMLRSLLKAMRLTYDKRGYLRKLQLVDTLHEAYIIAGKTSTTGKHTLENN